MITRRSGRREWKLRATVLCLVFVSIPAAAEEWGWPARYTEASSSGLTELHSAIHGSARLTDGVPVEDLHFRSDFFDLHMRSGAIHLEPEIDGYSAGSFFVGQATVSFAPESKKAQADLELHLGSPTMDRVPISEAYLFTLAGASLPKQLEAGDDASVPFQATESYVLGKRALRQTGMRLVHSFLNRETSSKGSVFVLFAPQSIRTPNSPESFLLYSLDPQRPLEVALEVFGNENFVQDFNYVHHFLPVAELHSETARFAAPGDISDYRIRMQVAGAMGRVEQEAAADLVPGRPVTAAQFQMTSRLKVESVSLGAEGEPLDFLQWGFLGDEINFDENLLVRFDPPLEPGKPHEVVIRSAGPLFDGQMLAEEDWWHPYLDDRKGSRYELWVTVPKAMTAVGAGRLLSEEMVEGKRQYHFKTSRPHKRSTFYCGHYDSQKGKADDIQVEVFLDRALQDTHSDLKWAVNEVTNAVRVFNRILMPLELDHLRVAGTPTGHGRGFEGLILMSSIGVGNTGSGGDFFRAHEVAHQWWGNMVQPKNWPDDRWLSESTAEYAAMEYYQIRYQKPGKTRAQIRERWIQPTFRVPDEPYKTLTGEKRKERASEIYPLIAGTSNVYTKGPLVLHMLRYMFQVRHGSDEKFWLVLQGFLEQYKYQQADTEDFIRIAETQMGGRMEWFWNQWLYGRKIPKVRWSYRVEKASDQWKLTVEAEQQDTEFNLAIPVYIELADGRTATSPLILQGRSGTREMKLPAKPKKVSLNDNFEALVELTR